jgi:hypothetical protein
MALQIRARQRAAFAFAFSLGLVGCGVSPSETQAPADPAALDGGSETASGLCAAVPNELAAEAMGGPVGSGAGGDLFPDGTYCVFSTDDQAVRVEVQHLETTREAFDAQAEAFGLTELTDGAGEAAYVRDTSVQGEVGSWLYAFGNGSAVSVDVQGPDDQAAQLSAAKAIVSAVLAESD